MKQQLLDTLEQIAGKENIHPNEPMSRHTTFRVGGPADVLVTPEAGKLAAVTGACREAGEQYPPRGRRRHPWGGHSYQRRDG